MKNIYPRLSRSSLCRVHNRHVLRAVSPGNAVTVGEGRRFFRPLPRFCLRRRLKGLRGTSAEKKRKKVRESERCKVREKRPRRDGSCWDVWETGLGYANPRLVERGSTREGGIFAAKKKATTFISALCSRLAVDQWHGSYANRRRAIEESPRPFSSMSALWSSTVWKTQDASDTNCRNYYEGQLRESLNDTYVFLFLPHIAMFLFKKYMIIFVRWFCMFVVVNRYRLIIINAC